MEEIPLKLYVIYSLVFYWLMGISAYLFDRRFCVHIFRKKYNMTHESELLQGEEYGFIYNRRGRVKIFWAALIAAVTNFLMIIIAHSNPVVEVFTYFFDSILVFLGFLCGPLAYKIAKGKDKALEKLDEIQEDITSGKFQEEIKSGAAEVVRDLRTSGSEVVGSLKDEAVGAANVVATAITGRPRFGADAKASETKETKAPEPEEETEEQLREKIEKFTKRK